MRVSVPATSANLGPGFDCLGLAVNLKNQVIIKPSKFHSVSLKGEGSNNPVLKDNNMFISIFNDFYNNLTSRKRHFRFEFFNEIPLSRGLGSSSAVIVSAIASAYAIEGIKLEKDKLLNLALAYENHPDNITPAVMGGFCVASVQENEVKYINKSMPKTLKAVVVIPNRAISTQLSRKTLPYKYSKEDAIFNISHSSLLTASFMSENWDMLKYASQDMFHQKYRMKHMPELFEVQKIALLNGALMSTLSGSGSTMLSICLNEDSNKLTTILKEKFPHFKVLSVDFDNVGVRVEL
ncbi:MULTISPECIES: homoserine kinase [Aliarcobacter]|uniref:Homoserine kinase n=2 Tax=Aliarcobacter skirrowii TaxID=28200 RepID=A0A2U2C342_9BACT|nr:homoserine kinase [Aliarcobacter skirrowii]AXX84100.1 homoserine kinase [Aliarcobacter skirrowii CCUG 10374]AZL53271.1 homoserine kinase [Aliarcobacter skirrowii]KAB0621713.1 homoserine kinase [Aliarcobacter skirrowii CCUG 10374]MDD2507758.1 homoserine kinase [Aliarcobacter skirrowii]MDD3025430.1 homoserine kinase [Aliarcobacter skirrowii]